MHTRSPYYYYSTCMQYGIANPFLHFKCHNGYVAFRVLPVTAKCRLKTTLHMYMLYSKDAP